MTVRVMAVLLCGAALARAQSVAPPPAVTALSATAQLGRQIFFDPSLSASGQLSCASCHSPAYSYSSPNGGFGPAGGAQLNQPALRAVPSLRYLDHTPRFTRHYYVDHGEEREDEGPAGGFMLDGRADSLHTQALLPWLDAAEMANLSVEAPAGRGGAARRAGLPPAPPAPTACTPRRYSPGWPQRRWPTSASRRWRDAC